MASRNGLWLGLRCAQIPAYFPPRKYNWLENTSRNLNAASISNRGYELLLLTKHFITFRVVPPSQLECFRVPNIAKPIRIFILYYSPTSFAPCVISLDTISSIFSTANITRKYPKEFTGASL